MGRPCSKSTAYAYDDLNRLLSEGGHTYTYDRNGNRSSKAVAGADTTTYTYDTHDRMVAVDRDAQRVFDAEYDYRTRRLAKTEGAETTVYRYDGGTSFQEVQDGVITLELIRGTGMGGGIGSILYTDRHDNSGGGPPGSLTTEYFAYNAVGHTVALTDTSGNVTKTNAYEAFGSVVAETGSSTNNKLANTKERDTSTALDNHGFRYYDPSTGLYITRDPIGYGDGLNVYLYVGGNPVNRVDPLGLQVDAEEEALARAMARMRMSPARRAHDFNSGNLSTKQAMARSSGGGNHVAAADSARDLGTYSTEPTEAATTTAFVTALNHYGLFSDELRASVYRQHGISGSMSETLGDGALLTSDITGLAAVGVGLVDEGVQLSSWSLNKISQNSRSLFNGGGGDASGLGGGLASEITGEAIDPIRFERMRNAFVRNGGVIDQGADVQAYLRSREAGGLTLNSTTILLPERPTTTAVFEEFIHTAQHRTGRFDRAIDQYGNARAIDMMEVEAAQRLIRNRRVWDIPNSETRQTVERLRGLRENLEK